MTQSRGNSAVAFGRGVLQRLGRRRGQAQSSSEKRLWWVHHYAVSPDQPESLRYWELSTLLKQTGWDTTLFASAFNHKSRKYERPVSLKRPVLTRDEQGIRFIWFYTTPYQDNDWRRYLNMASFFVFSTAVGMVGKRPDVVIGTSPNMLAALSGWIIAKRHRTPFILEIMDLWPESLIQLGLDSRPVIAALKWLETFLYRRADLIVALAEGIRDDIAKRGDTNCEIVFIPNASMRPSPVDPDARAETRRRMGWESKVVAIFAGAHGPANDLDQIIDAAREMQDVPDVLFVLLGDGPSKPGLVERARSLPNVLFLDAVPKGEVAAILRAADIGLLTLKKLDIFLGARPNKLFDYMSNGLPIVTTVDGEARKVAMEANAGVYADSDVPHEFSSRIRELAGDALRRETMARAGFDYVSNFMTREDTAVALDALLRDALTRSKGN